MKYKAIVMCAAGVVLAVALGLGVAAYQRAHLMAIVQKHFGDGDGGKLVYAALTGDEKGLEYYLSRGVSIDEKETIEPGLTPLNIAILRRDKRAVLLLLQHGANPNAGKDKSPKDTPVNAAIDFSKDENDTWFVETLLKHGADPNENLEDAITSHSVPIVKLMVDAGADVNRKDVTGRPPVVNAAMTNADRVVLYLLQNGADPTIKDQNQETILDWIHRDVNYQPVPGDDRSKEIEWLKEHHFWKEKDEIWREEHVKAPAATSGTHE